MDALRFMALGLVLSVLACEPAFDRPRQHVDRNRILAASTVPAEATPDAEVFLTMLAAGPTGTLVADEVQIAVCSEPQDLTESTAVAQACLEPTAPWIDVIASGPAGTEFAVQIPDDACALFGSEPPPALPGERPRRPVDPDLSGGYYQPVRIVLVGADETAFARVRLSCALPAAPAPVARDYAERYVANNNPVMTDLRAAAVSVPAGTDIELTALVGDDARESYVRYVSSDAVLEETVETLAVSWFTTAGSLTDDRTVIAVGSSEATTRWTAPEQAGPVTLWAVVRDDRGGAGWAQVQLDVIDSSRARTSRASHARR